MDLPIMDELSSAQEEPLFIHAQKQNVPRSPLAPVSAHCLAIGDKASAWALWRLSVLRGSGFPVELVLKLSTSEGACAADEVIHGERQEKQLYEASIIDIREKMNENAGAEEKRRFTKLLRYLKQGNVDAIERAQPIGLGHLEAWSSARRQNGKIQNKYQAVFHTEINRLALAIAEVARMDRFSEAVIWQNRRAFHTGIVALLRHQTDIHRNSLYRQHEVLVANYLQRYCVKNDTIGFFGPVGWASFSDGESSVLKPGEQLLASRTVYFESWAIEALATSLLDNAAFLPWLPPRRHPSLSLSGMMLHMPGRDPMRLTPGLAVLLRACDGKRLARNIAQAALRIPGSPFTNEKEIYDLLGYLRRMGLLFWQFAIPIAPYPERALRQQLERIEDEALSQYGLDTLTRLEERRKQVARAVGNPQALDECIEALETEFTSITGREPIQPGSEGQVYAGRTLIYEDCRRNCELVLGQKFFSRLGTPLSLLLDSARWFTYHTQRICRQALTQLYQKMVVTADGSSTIDAAYFWPRAIELLLKEGSGPIEDLVADFQQRWGQVLSLPDNVRKVYYTSKELRDKVHSLFAAPGPGWSTARYHCPDIMIAATDIDAIARDDYHLAMGELHMGMNTLNAALFLAQHPDPDSVLQMFETDVSETRIIPIPPAGWQGLTTRTSPTLISSRDILVQVSNNVSHRPVHRTIPIGDLVIANDNGIVYACTRDGQLRIDLIELFAEALSLLTADLFHILPLSEHSPRVTIDHLTVCRERWTFPVTDLSFSHEKNEAGRFLAARRWMHTYHLPRFIFVKTPVERKPFYVDLASPIYVELFVKAICRARNAGSEMPIMVTEMLPEPHQAWLIDARGQRYTCELRCIAVDRCPPVSFLSC
jgi:hypothetical protein